MQDEVHADLVAQTKMEQALVKSRLREYITSEESVRYAHNDVLEHMALAIELLHKRVTVLESTLAGLQGLVENQVESVIENYDFSDVVSDVTSDIDYKIESALDDYDVSDKVADALESIDWDERVASAMSEMRCSEVLTNSVVDLIDLKLADGGTYSPIDTALRKFFYNSTFTVRPE